MLGPWTDQTNDGKGTIACSYGASNQETSTKITEVSEQEAHSIP